MKKLRNAAPGFILMLALFNSCASYTAWQKGKTAETSKDWDKAVIEYEKALQVDPDNRRFLLSLQRARREASRAHF
jgi:tetratricopeptide (TPR) repeat protein